jgi:hypothetical protein
MSLMSAVRASGLARRVGWPAMSTAAGSLKECLLNVPATEVSKQKVVVDPWIRDPGWVKCLDPAGSGMDKPVSYFLELRNNFLG